MTSSAASRMAWAMSASTTPCSSLAEAAAHLIIAWAWNTAAGTGWPETGKFSTARCVEAPHSASAGICISPIVSWAVRNSAMVKAPGRRRARRRSSLVLGTTATTGR